MPYKILTHKYGSPIQGGDPIADGTFPVTLPQAVLDTSDDDCGSGWNYCDDIETALGIAGLWPNGWSALVLDVTPSEDAIMRGKKRRASSLTINGVVSDNLVRDAIQRFSIPFGTFNDVMAAEQWLWFEALRRPLRSPETVEDGLRGALAARGLDWSLRRFDTGTEAWATRDAQPAWDARATRDARGARAAQAAWGARAAQAAWNAWNAWGAWDAWGALTVHYAAISHWTHNTPDLLSAGLRDAYRNGLAIALPTGPNVLGWAMVGDDERHPALAPLENV